jgi:hypothetical protein
MEYGALAESSELYEDKKYMTYDAYELAQHLWEVARLTHIITRLNLMLSTGKFL